MIIVNDNSLRMNDCYNTKAMSSTNQATEFKLCFQQLCIRAMSSTNRLFLYLNLYQSDEFYKSIV